VIHAFFTRGWCDNWCKRIGGTVCKVAAGTSLGDGVRIGNFVEIKAATLEDGSEGHHLS